MMRDQSAIIDARRTKSLGAHIGHLLLLKIMLAFCI